MKNKVRIAASYLISAAAKIGGRLLSTMAGKGADMALAIRPRTIEQPAADAFMDWLGLSDASLGSLRASVPKAAHVYDFSDYHTGPPGGPGMFALSPADG